MSTQTKNNFESLTNVAYAVAGLALPLFAPFTDIWLLSFLLIVLAWFSYLGHAKSGWYWLLDWAGMGMVFGGLIAYAVKGDFIAQYFGALAGGSFAFLVQYYEEQFDQIWRYGSIVLLWIFAVINLYDYGHNVWPGVITFGIAVVIRQVGEKYDNSENEYLHGWWHIITALGFVLLITL